jgi:hypothetical protein
MINRNDSPFCSLSDAAEYLCLDEETVSAMRTTSEQYVHGKIRSRVIADNSKRNKVRLEKADVFKILKPFDI